MNTTRFILTVFFMLLTLSIGMVTIHSPLNINAQNSALFQSGNGDSEQETEQGQSSSQANQVVSGDSSFASGNNLLCKTMDKTIAVLGWGDQCEENEPNTPPEQGNTGRIVISVRSAVSFGCEDCFGNFGNITLDAGQRYVEHLTHSKEDFMVQHFFFTYNIPVTVTGGKLMIDLKPVLGSQKLMQFNILWDERRTTANCSPYSLSNPHTTCTISDINPKVPIGFQIAIYYDFPNKE